MRTAYIDAFSGVSGDMLVGALLDAGASEAALREALTGLPVSPFQLTIRRETRGAFVGTRFLVEAPPENRHRHLSDLLEIVERSKLSSRVRANAASVFTRIAKAEAAAHGISLDEVHFHEVGAVDTIVDVLAACFAFENLGIEQVGASALELGSGFVRCDHGKIPVPAPGALGALVGVKVRLGGLAGERTTPTGAALVATYANSVGEPMELTPSSVGYGVGGRETPDVANLLRVIVGEAARLSDRVVVIESNLDDVTGETLGFVLERLMSAGALDVFLTPVVMKKGRPGFVVTVLAPPERSTLLAELLLRETPTLGVRQYWATRSKLPREVKVVETPFGEARVKVRWVSDGEPEVSAEFDDARRIALERNMPLTQVVQQIEDAGRKALAGAVKDKSLALSSPSTQGAATPEAGNGPGHGPTRSRGHSHSHIHPHGPTHPHAGEQGHSHSL